MKKLFLGFIIFLISLTSQASSFCKLGVGDFCKGDKYLYMGTIVTITALSQEFEGYKEVSFEREVRVVNYMPKYRIVSFKVNDCDASFCKEQEIFNTTIFYDNPFGNFSKIH